MQAWVASAYIGLSLTAGLLVQKRVSENQRLVALALADDFSFQLPAWARNHVSHATLMI